MIGWSVVICLSAHPRNHGFLVERDSMGYDITYCHLACEETDKRINFRPEQHASKLKKQHHQATNGPTKVHWDHNHGGGASTRHLGPLNRGSWLATGTELAVFFGQGVIIDHI